MTITATCPNQAAHTPAPSTYLGWHAWAEQMQLTHEQHPCPVCHSPDIWRPKPGLTKLAAPAIRDSTCDRCDTPYAPGALIRTDCNGGWIASACCPPLPCLSVRQPWAYAITALGKPIENRTWLTNYTGPLAIHASARWDNDGQRRIAEQTGQVVVKTTMSAIVAIVELAGVHRSFGCIRPARERHTHPDGPFTCSPWAAGLGEPDGMWHWELVNPRQLAEPVECKGRLGLWEAPPEVEAAVLAQIGANA